MSINGKTVLNESDKLGDYVTNDFSVIRVGKKKFNTFIKVYCKNGFLMISWAQGRGVYILI